mmetsp:Transcript_59181/g.157512  ORF Transcript_59181/g.157512 Transcript_59181/m.157512 type:complete len:224 (-) Transcript_59181:299-970(-)
MRDGCDHLLGTSGLELLGSQHQGPTGISHVVDDYATLSRDLAHQQHLRHLVWSDPLLREDGERHLPKSRCKVLRPLRTTSIGRHDNNVSGVDVRLQLLNNERHSIEIVNGIRDETLNLGGMEIHCNRSVRASDMEHVSNKFPGDWRPGPVFLVLPGVTIHRHYSRDSFRATTPRCVKDDQEFHQSLVRVRITRGLHHKHVAPTHCLIQKDLNLAVLELIHCRG